MRAGRKTITSRRILVVWVMILCVAGLLMPMAQRAQEQETTRNLWDTAFTNQGNKPAAARRSARRNYRIVTPHVPVMGVAADSVIGVTLWRLRPSRPADAGERIITHEGPESVEWLPERLTRQQRNSRRGDKHGHQAPKSSWPDSCR